jgi:hypothetical protein
MYGFGPRANVCRWLNIKMLYAHVMFNETPDIQCARMCEHLARIWLQIAQGPHGRNFALCRVF